MKAFNKLALLYLPLLVLTVLVPMTHGKPIFDLLFGGYSGGYSDGYRGGYSRGVSSRQPRQRSPGGYEEYKSLCKVINPDPYAFPGSNPFPAAPFCPP